MVVYTCNSRHSGGRDRRITSLRPVWAKLMRFYFKIKMKKREEVGGTDPVEEHLPSKLEAPRFKPQRHQKKNHTSKLKYKVNT
jgi:hypothetical protein